MNSFFEMFYLQYLNLRYNSAYNVGDPGFNPWVRNISWRRKWQSTPEFLPGKSHGWRNLATVHGVAKNWTRLPTCSRQFLYLTQRIDKGPFLPKPPLLLCHFLLLLIPLFSPCPLILLFVLPQTVKHTPYSRTWHLLLHLPKLLLHLPEMLLLQILVELSSFVLSGLFLVKIYLQWAT